MPNKQINETEVMKEKPFPAYLLDNYPYPSFGEALLNDDSIKTSGSLYEIECPNCKMSIRAKGQKLKSTYERLVKNGGCFCCGHKELKIFEVDMSKKAD